MTKVITFSIALLAAIVSPVSAQEARGFKVTAITVSSGEDALASGITGIIDLENEKKTMIEVAVQHEQAWVIAGKNFNLGKIKGTAAASAGHFQGSPWAGPFLNLEAPLGQIGGQKLSVSTMVWPGLFFGWEPRDWKNDGIKNPESLYSLFFMSSKLGIGPLGFTYAVLNYLDDPWNVIPGVSYTQPVRKDMDVSGSVSRNQNAKKWLFYIGVTWKPNK